MKKKAKEQKPEIKKAEDQPVTEEVTVSPPVVVPEVKAEEKTEETKDVLVDKPAGVRLQAVEVQPAEALTAVKPEGLGASIDNLAKIVDQGEVKTVPVVEPAEKKAGSKLTYIAAVVLAFLLGLVSGIGVGYFVWGREVVKTTNPEKTALPTISQPTPTKTATSATPTIKLVKSQLKIQVLNGTSGKGVAAKARDVLVAAGYSGVAIGNADESNYELTEISIKLSKRAYLEELSKDLTAGKYTLDSQVNDLPENSEYDAVIVIGTK